MGPRERLSGRPVMEISHGSIRLTGRCSGPPCQRPQHTLRGDHGQDHRRAGGRPPPLGAAVGLIGCPRATRNAEERRDRPGLQRHQRPHSLGHVVEHGFTVQTWLTFRQALALGGHVRKGERGTTIVYADRFIPDDVRHRAHERGEEPRAFPFLKRFTVFNVEQCEGLPNGIAAAPPPVDTSLILPQVEELIRATGAEIRIGGDKAYYDVAGDFIRVPPPQAFFKPINWHRTAVHELSHWNGAANRLARDLSGSFGSKHTSRKNCAPKFLQLSFAPRSASCRPCGMPTTSVPGSSCWAKTIGRSCARPRRRRGCRYL